MKNPSPLKPTAYAIVFLIFVFFLPAYAAIHLKYPIAPALFWFYLVNIALACLLLRGHSQKKHNLQLRCGGFEEKINILTSLIKEKSRNIRALQEKISRYSGLKRIIEEINQNLDSGHLGDKLTGIAFSLIAKNRGACILYLINPDTQRLELFKAKSEYTGLTIPDKEGDIFDSWILRHNSPILIEDIKKDFRFDLESDKAPRRRPIASLIGAPLVSDHKLLGILRLDNARPGFYTQDDLRLLLTISDFGAVALDNSRLYRETEDLAIHDSLTGFYTKGHFAKRLREETERSLSENTALSLLMLDIDKFKDYNDKFGHSAGDIVLKSLSLVIRASLGQLNPLIGRFGGEEFCIALPHTGKEKAVVLAKDLLSRIENTKITLRRHQTQVTVSIGLAAFPLDASSQEDLVFKADKAMYEAKRKGRDQVAQA